MLVPSTWQFHGAHDAIDRRKHDLDFGYVETGIPRRAQATLVCWRNQHALLLVARAEVLPIKRDRLR